MLAPRTLDTSTSCCRHSFRAIHKIPHRQHHTQVNSTLLVLSFVLFFFSTGCVYPGRSMVTSFERDVSCSGRSLAAYRLQGLVLPDPQSGAFRLDVSVLADLWSTLVGAASLDGMCLALPDLSSACCVSPWQIASLQDQIRLPFGDLWPSSLAQLSERIAILLLVDLRRRRPLAYLKLDLWPWGCCWRLILPSRCHDSGLPWLDWVLWLLQAPAWSWMLLSQHI